MELTVKVRRRSVSVRWRISLFLVIPALLMRIVGEPTEARMRLAVALIAVGEVRSHEKKVTVGGASRGISSTEVHKRDEKEGMRVTFIC